MKKGVARKEYNAVAFDPKIHATLILWMSRSGLTMQEIADELGISKKKLHIWRNEHEEVANALRAGRKWFDATVEHRLFQNATGMTITETSQHFVTDPETGERKLTGETVSRRELPPNTTAQIFWLKNRMPKEWRDRQEIDLSGDIVIGLPPRPEDAYPEEVNLADRMENTAALDE